MTIELLADASGDNAAPAPATLQAIADALGEIFGSTPGGTWVRAETTTRERYAENGQGVPADVRPAFVRVLKADLEDAAALAAQARQINAVVARHLERPSENVHVLFEPAARGRIAFGGELLT